MGMLYLHNDIFLSDIMGYDQLKFSYIYAPKIKSWYATVCYRVLV